MEFIRFFFTNFWHFCGLVVVLILIIGMIETIFRRRG